MKKPLQIIYQVYRYLLYLLAFLLLLLAIVVTLLQYFVRNIDDYQQEVVDYLQQQIALEFSIEAIRGSWDKRTPTITVQGFEIQTKDDREFRLGDFYLSLDIIKTLRSKQLVLKSFSIKNADLNFQQQANGAWQIVGMEDFLKMKLKKDTASQSAQSPDANPQQLLANIIDHLNLIDIQKTTLDFHFYEGGSFELRDIDIQLEGDSRKRHMTISSIVDKQHVMNVYADIEGRPNDKNFSVKAYGKLNETELTGFIPLDDRAYQLEKFSANGEFWAEYANGFLQLVGEVGIPELRLKNQDGVLLGDFRSDFVVENTWGDELNVWLDGVSWLWSGKTQAFSRVFMKHDYQSNEFDIAIPSLDLRKLNDSLLASGLLNEKLQQQLSTMQLTGELKDLYLSMSLDSTLADSLEITAVAAAVSSKAYKGIPGFENVNGRIRSNLKQGWIDVVTDDRFAIDLPYVYQEPLAFEQVSGRVSWLVEAERFYVSSPSLHMQEGEQTGQVFLDLDLPRKKDGAEPWMTLMVSLANADASIRNKFIPYTLPAETLNWLEKSIISGTVNNGAFIYEGSIANDAVSKPAVQLLLDIENAELKFAPDWPAAKNMKGRLLLDDTEVIADLSAGTFSELNLEDTKVRVFAPQGLNGTVVDVHAYFNGNLANAFALLKQSPIHDVIGTAMDSWQFIGTVNGDVDLRIPLNSQDQDSLKTWVNANLKKSSMRIPELDLVLNHITGAIHYDEDTGLSSYGLEGTLWGEVLKARIETESPVTKINIETLFDSQKVGQWLKQPLFEFTEGKAEAKAEIHIAEKSWIDISSDLKGIRFDLPTPFAKRADIPEQLNVHIPLAETFIIDAKLEHMGNLKLAFEPDLSRAEFAIRSEARLENSKGFEVTGNLKSMDLDKWLPIIDRYIELLEQQSSASNSSSNTSAMPMLFSMNELTVGRAFAFGSDWGEAEISVMEDAEFWTVDFATQDAIGQVLLHDEKPLEVVLDFLKIDSEEEPAVVKTQMVETQMGETKIGEPKIDIATLLAEDPLKEIASGDIPDMDVEMRSVFVGKEDFGNWRFQLRNVDGDYHITNLTSTIKGLALSGNAIWNPGNKLSTFNGKASSLDFGYVLEQWEFARSLEAKQTEFNLDVSWPGSPVNFNTEFLSGDIGFNIRDGYFMEAASSASGALKALSLLNIAKISKRLKLDFSDMKKGVNFDRMLGAMRIEEEIAEITRDVDIKSTAGRFQISGQIDLKHEQFANQLVLTLPVSNNLPWIAVLVGGLNPVGLGAAAVAKVLDKQVDKLSSGVYSITGSFDNPKIEFIKVFSDKNEKLHVERKASQGELNISTDVQKLKTQELKHNAESVSTVAEESQPETSSDGQSLQSENFSENEGSQNGDVETESFSPEAEVEP